MCWLISLLPSEVYRGRHVLSPATLSDIIPVSAEVTLLGLHYVTTKVHIHLSQEKLAWSDGQHQHCGLVGWSIVLFSASHSESSWFFSMVFVVVVARLPRLRSFCKLLPPLSLHVIKKSHTCNTLGCKLVHNCLLFFSFPDKYSILNVFGWSLNYTPFYLRIVGKCFFPLIIHSLTSEVAVSSCSLVPLNVFAFHDK